MHHLTKNAPLYKEKSDDEHYSTGFWNGKFKTMIYTCILYPFANYLALLRNAKNNNKLYMIIQAFICKVCVHIFTTSSLIITIIHEKKYI